MHRLKLMAVCLVTVLGNPMAWSSNDTAPAMACNNLMTTQEPETRLASAKFFMDHANLPPFCQVEGKIAERLGFVMRLPVDAWNGKFAVTGCGGFCGSLNPDKPGYSNSMNASLKLGYAVIQTDGGHQADSWDTDWAIGDQRALELYAGAWMPLAVASGNALLKQYYQDKPQRTYFSGCSNGGRLGMVAAQRYPRLFDGIAAGGAIFDLTGNAGIHGMWKLQTTHDENGGEIIDQDKLPLLTEHVMQQCDSLDGVEDHVISRPQLCQPALDSLRCSDTRPEACFSDRELTAIQLLYQGATVDGQALFPGIPPGSESLWSRWIVGTDENPAWGTRASEGNLRLTYGIPSNRPFNPHAYTLADEQQNLQRLAPVLNATNPDLSALAAAGGKLFYYHGLADPLILAGRAQQYHDEAAAVMGKEKLDQTARFFMVPGHGHCWEMPGQVADDFNPLVVIDHWVETGKAPDHVIAGMAQDASPNNRTRLLCPYPLTATFQGGDPDNAQSFRCQAADRQD